MPPPTQHNYYLLRDRPAVAEGNRLLKQHHLQTRIIKDGQLLHQGIGKKPKAIADLGCGTGIWLNEVVKTHFPPSHEHEDGEEGEELFVGWDATSAMFLADRDPRVRLLQHDCTEPVPSEYHNKFDLVYIGILFMAIPARKWPAVIDNVVKLLKPGGYFDWLEGEIWNTRPVKPSALIERMVDIVGAFRSAQGYAPYIPPVMLETVLGARDANNTDLHSGRAFNVVNFAMIPLNTPDAILKYGQEANEDFGHVLSEALVLLFQTIAHRVVEKPHTEEHRLVLQQTSVEELDSLSSELRNTQTLETCGYFPRLLAQKATGKKFMPTT